MKAAAKWAQHAAEWRDPAQICSQWSDAGDVDAKLLESRPSRGWWALLQSLGITLLVTREYEHLAMAMSVVKGRPRLSYFAVPHPSGLAVDTESVRMASTRNPNQVFRFEPAQAEGNPLMPVNSTYYPGSLYLHDLAFVGRKLFGNAVGRNAVAELRADGRYELAWWPAAVERKGVPDFSKNYLQMNSIAAGARLNDCCFSASSATMGRLRPGHLNYPVDGQGVIFSGRTHEPICTGLTRPHSARFRGRELWVANSGYGQLGFVDGERLNVVATLPGWTRGLCVTSDVAFVGLSRVIPHYARYAPGLDAAKSRCGVYAVDCRSGRTLGSLEWPGGNQIFAIEAIDAGRTAGFPFDATKRKLKRERDLFSAFRTEAGKG